MMRLLDPQLRCFRTKTRTLHLELWGESLNQIDCEHDPDRRAAQLPKHIEPFHFLHLLGREDARLKQFPLHIHPVRQTHSEFRGCT